MVEEEHEHPVASGLGALIGVGLGVGLILALVALVTSQVLGLGAGGGRSSGEAGPVQRSLYLPTPVETPTPTGPLVTLAPGKTPLVMPIATAPPGLPSLDSSAGSTPVPGGISLTASRPSVAAMEQIDLTGTYPGGQGATLQVQRFAGGNWADFPVTVSVTGGSFSTYVQTGQTGENRFRVLDPASGTSSNEVVVRVG